MKINEYIRHKTIYFIITLLVVIVLSVSSSFAFLNNRSDTVSVNNLDVKYKTIKKNSLYLEKTIDITNNTNTYKTYHVYASSLEDSNTIGLPDRRSRSVLVGDEVQLSACHFLSLGCRGIAAL